ncbi:MAG: alkaline phosphatase D family protein [Blastocatellia bacterium]|nr:alkaline phosphatase D family protein [Blastocatellia bacterium]MCS7156923.1 alkaline phosphatase D family protein [Blastocatellia bacterium]MCX7752122.1 alkaline phosphatase D family protein [Blastocatellia bacterium]MDW8167615.1 alkaline phosphatase D family protein [Acidobacteriota bacterium]MDW8256215.1 alkaline phosphatase D family protein [Acidobacteriota bacterium]
MRNRSRFLPILMFLALEAVVRTFASASPEAARIAHGLEVSGPIVGEVTEDSALLWARANREAILQVEYGTEADLATSQFTEPIRLSSDRDFTAEIPLSELLPHTRYFYRLHVQDPTAPSRAFVSSIGQFLTAPEEDEWAPLAFAYSGDAGEAYQPFRLFDAVRAQRPDFFLFLGDTIYADQGPGPAAKTLAEYRLKYLGNRKDAAFQRLARETSFYVMWDDHEIANNADRTHPRLPIARQAFLEYWPIRREGTDETRLYRSFRWGRAAEIFLLDCRQYRSPQSERDGPSKTMLGAEQKAWLKAALLASPATFKFIATTVPLKYHARDSWEGYRIERQEILNFIRAHRIENVIFLAADVHYAAVLRHAEGVLEVIAGPIAQFPSPIAFVGRRPEVEFTATNMYTYALVRVFPDRGEPRAEISIFNAAGKRLHTMRVP